MRIQVKDYIDEKETALIGRDNGRLFKKKLEEHLGKLETLEKQNAILTFVIPANIITMNKSFFLGAFATRAMELGEEIFLAKYHFASTTTYIQEKIAGFVSYALKNSTMEEILRAKP